MKQVESFGNIERMKDEWVGCVNSDHHSSLHAFQSHSPSRIHPDAADIKTSNTVPWHRYYYCTDISLLNYVLHVRNKRQLAGECICHFATDLTWRTSVTSRCATDHIAGNNCVISLVDLLHSKLNQDEWTLQWGKNYSLDWTLRHGEVLRFMTLTTLTLTTS